jgi:RNA polymerase sigma-70 factor (sigma-E family)
VSAELAAGGVGEVVTAGRDEAAYAALFAAHHRAAMRLAFVLTGDAATAEDAVADAFAAMYPKWRAGRVGAPEAYLRRAVVNRVRGGIRRRVVRRRHERALRPAAAAAGPSDAGLGDRDRLRAALLALAPRQRAVLALRFLEDRSEADTAAVLGIAVGTVKSQTARALERLRAVLADTEGDE